MPFTTAMTTSFKVELATATHNFTTSTGNVFGVALGKVAAARTYDATTVNLAALQTATTDEVASGGGYTTNGFLWTAAQNTTPTSTGTTAFWSWSVNPSWTSASFSTIGCLLYNNTAAGKNSVYVGDFAGTQTVTAGTLTLILPANAAGTSLLRIA
jgi:hypothetical protein